MQVTLEQQAVTAGGDLGRAREVAVADLAFEALVAPDIAIADKAAVERIARRVRHGDAEERIEVLEVLARERHLHVEGVEPQQARDRAAGMRAGGTGRGAQVDGVGRAGRTELQRRGHRADQLERLPAPVPVALQRQWAHRCVRGFATGDGQVDVGLARGIDEAQAPGVHLQVVDAGAGAVAATVVEHPVAAVLAGFQQDVGACRRSTGMLARPVSSETGVRGVSRSVVAISAVSDHVGIARQLFRPDDRGAPRSTSRSPPMSKLPGLRGHDALDRALEPVPVPEQHQHQQGQRGDYGPGAPRMGTGGLQATAMRRCVCWAVVLHAWGIRGGRPHLPMPAVKRG